MSAAANNRMKSVDELKAFLRERGINTSVYRKESLIRLVEAASEINLEPEEVEKLPHRPENRRTIDTTCGEKILLPDLVSVIDWTDDLPALPNVEMGDIFIYLLSTCMWSNERLKAYKSDNSYQLFMQRHVDYVVMKSLPHEHFYIKCFCTPETRQRDHPYTTWILMDNKATVKSGGCTCVADDGSCKHCVALLFALNEFAERHKDRGTEACTDTQCKWDRPRQSSNPATVSSIDFGKKDKRENYKPFLNEGDVNVNRKSIMKSFFKVCKDHGSCFTHTVDPPTDESDVEDDDINNNYLSLPEIISKYKSGKK